MSQGRFESSALTAVSGRFLDAFSAANIDGMRALLAEDMIAYITTAAAGWTRCGARYVPGSHRGDGPAVRTIQRQSDPAAGRRSPDPVLIMVEIRAERRGRFLHNFAAHLLASPMSRSPTGGWLTQSPRRATSLVLEPRPAWDGQLRSILGRRRSRVAHEIHRLRRR
jgi:hypothetical protein